MGNNSQINGMKGKRLSENTYTTLCRKTSAIDNILTLTVWEQMLEGTHAAL